MAAVGLGLGYDVAVSYFTNLAGTEAAQASLQDFPNQSLEQYRETRRLEADSLYNRYSLFGNVNFVMKKIFEDKK